MGGPGIGGADHVKGGLADEYGTACDVVNEDGLGGGQRMDAGAVRLTAANGAEERHELACEAAVAGRLQHLGPGS
jgi:hypothetical protein